MSAPVFASDPNWTECDPIETVTGMEHWKPEIKVGSLSDFDGKGHILLNGWLETPSPGYSYEIRLGELANDVQNINLKLIAPNAFASAVIDKISISERFESPMKIRNIAIIVEKDFGWGPKVINCNLS